MCSAILPVFDSALWTPTPQITLADFVYLLSVSQWHAGFKVLIQLTALRGIWWRLCRPSTDTVHAGCTELAGAEFTGTRWSTPGLRQVTGQALLW